MSESDRVSHCQGGFILHSCGLALASLLACSPAYGQASDMVITAEFRPSQAHPGRTRFVDTTDANLDICERLGVLGCDGVVRTGLNVRYPEILVGAPADEQVLISMNGSAQSIVVTHEATGERFDLEFKLVSIGSYTRFSENVADTTGEPNVRRAHDLLWEGGGLNSNPLPCVPAADFSGTEGPRTAGWIWKFPDGGGQCGKTTRFNQSDLQFQGLNFGYVLTAPSPLEMRNGIYRGSHRFTLGEGADISFGRSAILNRNEVNVEFILSVEHEFDVVFPVDSPTINLAAVGGWTQWTDYGRAPSGLAAELPFTVSASANFSISMQCEHLVGSECGIRNVADGEVVPIDVSVTMPGANSLEDGVPAIGYKLIPSVIGMAKFTPGEFLFLRPSKLKFGTSEGALDQMLGAEGSRWKGDVTLIFDSEI